MNKVGIARRNTSPPSLRALATKKFGPLHKAEQEMFAGFELSTAPFRLVQPVEEMETRAEGVVEAERHLEGLSRSGKPQPQALARKAPWDGRPFRSAVL